MRIGLFGGSFDPVHKAHLRLALDAKEEFKLDKVIFVPALVPPHKRFKKLARAEDRIKMIKAAVNPIRTLKFRRFETNRKVHHVFVRHGKTLQEKISRRRTFFFDRFRLAE